MAIGTYWSPWFPYTVASIYHAVDEIIVVNYGHDLQNPERLKSIDRVSEWIKRLDFKEKILEVTRPDQTQLRHNYPIGTQRAANERRKTPQGEGNWFDMRGFNLTVASELAVDRKADWILKVDTDEVCYADALKVKKDIEHLPEVWGTNAFYQYEFAGDVGPTELGTEHPWNYLADPPPASPWIDTVYTYRAYPEVWYLGAGAVANLPDERKPTVRYHCAHLREANPAWLSAEEKLEHFYGRILWRLYTNDYGYFSPEVLAKARKMAGEMLDRKKTVTDIEPPEACLYKDPLDYITEFR